AAIVATIVVGIKKAYPPVEYSEIFCEDARVAEMKHKPARLMPTFSGKNMIWIAHPESFNTKFEGIVNFDVHRRDIYERFSLNDKADVSYQIKYELDFEDINGDGVKEKFRKSSEYLFIDSQLKK
ncbi:MAG: hypothetical protein WC595_06570, partial [Candidatus Nanoarchaeia archaeon]